jgi:hypothetical protein
MPAADAIVFNRAVWRSPAAFSPEVMFSSRIPIIDAGYAIM